MNKIKKLSDELPIKNLLVILILITIAFANCKNEDKPLEAQTVAFTKGSTIKSAKKLKNFSVTDTFYLEAAALYEDIMIIEGERLILDFKGLTLIGTTDFTKPDAFQGVAIHIKNSKFVTIKNLNISGYRIAVQADNIQHLTLSNCNFSYNYRADSSANFDITNVKEGAIVLNNCPSVAIFNTLVSHNYNGIVLNQSNLIALENSKINFNAKVGLYFNAAKVQQLFKNQIDWNGTAGNYYQNRLNVGDYVANSMTHNGKIWATEQAKDFNDFSFSKMELLPKDEHEEMIKNIAIPTLDLKYPKGENYKLSAKYGVYDFEYPAVFLRTIDGKRYTFAMLGPTIGNWKFVHAENVRSTNLKTGNFPATFSIEKEVEEKPFSFEFQFIGAAFPNEFGVWNPKGKIFTFGYEE